ncbi:MAG: hypothetical protein MZU91_15020 [Desulfosudis oleivorans]|nr:hypothetical protein [Desulfosudis oleivorans]
MLPRMVNQGEIIEEGFNLQADQGQKQGTRKSRGAGQRSRWRSEAEGLQILTSWASDPRGLPGREMNQSRTRTRRDAPGHQPLEPSFCLQPVQRRLDRRHCLDRRLLPLKNGLVTLGEVRRADVAHLRPDDDIGTTELVLGDLGIHDD